MIPRGLEALLYQVVENKISGEKEGDNGKCAADMWSQHNKRQEKH